MNQERNKKILEMLKSGMTVRAVALDMKLHPSRIHQIKVRELGRFYVPIRKRVMHLRPLDKKSTL